MGDEYRFQLSLDMPVAVALGHYAPLVFPQLAQRAPELRTPLVALLVLAGGEPVGLALAQLLPEHRAAEIVACFVRPEHRGRHVGRRMIGHLERALARQGVAEAHLAFRDAWPGAPALRRILELHGWERPQARLLVGRSSQGAIPGALWLDRVQLPPRFSIFPWVELSAAERNRLLEEQRRRPWYPELLSPFQLPERIEPLNSLGLRRDDELVGWIVTHRLDQRTIQYTSLYVRPPFQSLGRAVPLLAEAIRRQLASGVPFGTFQVAPDNAAMVRFVRRRLAPSLVSFHTLYASRKRLAGSSPC